MAADRRHQADLERRAIHARIAYLWDALDLAAHRVERQHLFIAQAEGTLAGHRNTMANLERKLAEYQAALVETGAQDT